jgi:4-amino-4-deoxy-L-arabinose transferase-like glycosyltransferase
MRLPAQLLAGLGAALLVLAGASFGGSLLAGLLAAGWFMTLPRVWFNAGLHCFDVPIAVATLAVALTYRAALSDRRWALLLGPLLGVAIVIKHNALFLPLLFVVHYGLCLARAGAWRRPKLWLPLGLWSVALGAPLTAFALWPWLWTAPLARLTEYFEFHRLHAYYNTEFLGTNYNQPPLPTEYPLVLTWATVPTALLLLALVGLGIALWRDLSKKSGSQEAERSEGGPPAAAARPRSWAAPLRPEERLDGTLLALLAAFPLILIALPSVPIFGGTKHWLTAYPFLALAAAIGWGALWRHLALPRRWRGAQAIALIVLLVPSTWSTIHSHPFGLSAYAPLVGGTRGAAELGLMRGFWGHAMTPLLPEIDALDDRQRGRLYTHDLHGLSLRQYVREGRWPSGVRPTAVSRARAGLLFHERHMLTYEIELWQSLGLVSPQAIVELDDVPLTSLYVGD